MGQPTDDNPRATTTRPSCWIARSLTYPLCIALIVSMVHTLQESKVLWLLVSSPPEHHSATTNRTSYVVASVNSSGGRVKGEEPLVAKKNRSVFDVQCCGLSWQAFVANPDCIRASFSSADVPLLWTVSGGDEYRLFLPMLVENWERHIGGENRMLVVALDAATAQTACDNMFMSVHWDAPAQSYSRVADAKFQVAAAFARAGHYQLFAELDIFCRADPLPFLLREDSSADLLLIGHGDLQQKINIGMYYVKPTTANADLFSTVSILLAPSINATHQYRGNNNELYEYFDQDIFHHCLGVPERSATMLDPVTGKDALEPCHSITVPYKIVSNLYFSSYRPPIVHDTTVCLHPLDIRPFTSIRTKLATAKFYGFDPEVYDDSAMYLKTASGDLTYSEEWNTGFFADQFRDPDTVRIHLQRPIALLVALARASSRILVLPRNIRDKAGRAYPIFSLVSTASLERMGVRWRFWPAGSFHRIGEEHERIVELPSTFGLVLKEVLQNVTTACLGVRTCAVHGMYRNAIYPLKDKEGILDATIQNLTWCFQPPDFRDSFPFTHGFGAHESACP